MISSIHPVSKYQILKHLLLCVTMFWAASSTILLIRNKPQTILIGVDENGVRVIADEKDRLIAFEKVNFIKRFMVYYYNFDSEDYGKNTTLAGNLMNTDLWKQRENEFRKIKSKFETQPNLIQESKIEDIRMIDDRNYEADLALTIHNKLKVDSVKLRVNLKIAPHSRTPENPYSWEVVSYDESLR